ncbi:ketosynthase chain-length factor [Nonomuraea fastidiosa]|uniref:ketosynthase chain-length factor n=1 Tax=Nonomuraea TaxID=83681 RepID=UPI00343010FD
MSPVECPVEAAITGIGVVAPNGLTIDDYWNSVLAGKSGLRHITRFDATPYACRVAGEVPGFVETDHMPGRLVPQTDRWTHLGLAAAAMALDDAGVDPAALPEYDMAVVTASSSGGTEFGQREIEALWRRGPRSVGAYQSIAWFYAATTGQTSIRYGMRGPCGVLATEQAGGLDALAQARRLLRGGSRMVMTGGADASLCPYGLVAQTANGLLSGSDDPGNAYQPFGRTARGYVPGEGGAMFVMEDADAATGAPYGVLAGYMATFDPPPGVDRPPGLERAVRGALGDAGCDPGDIDVVFADSAGVARLDRLEADAITAVFGPRGVPVTAPKTMTGRLYAGGAALDVATALLAIRDGVIPPTAGAYDLADGIDIDLVRGGPRPAAVRTALVIARGYGGFNAALVLRGRPAGATTTEGRV